jgi:hypothetical protein
MSKRKFNKFEKWTLGLTGVVIALALVAWVSSFFIPEVRVWLHREKPLSPPPAVVTTELANTVVPSKQLAAESTPTPTPKVNQQAKVHVKGNGNVAGNNVAGSANVVGNNNNVTAPVIVAPGGIGITGGTVTNPTVNNFGPPPRSPSVIHVCISDPQPVETPTGEIRQVYTLTTDSEITGPTYVFEFSGPIIKQTSASSPDMAMNISEGLQSSSSFGFRLNETWFPGQRINVDVHSLSPVRLIKQAANFGESFVFQNGGCVSSL